MSDYSQPAFYRFNQDSLILVKWILKQGIRARHILDLGAGSGVIGMELANNLGPETLTLLELQNDFLPYLESNLISMKVGAYQTTILMSSFGEWVPEEKYDLIVSNPPYYLPGRGQASQDERKGKARSFLVDNWIVFLKKIEEALAVNGKAFIVIKNDKTLLNEIRKSLNGLKMSEHSVEGLVIVELA